ncbi:hypothetical protein N7493_004883 [Penicillium malachiteum]|uniref:Beta-glucuronidase C-terminal domain-containing protein n=1 Tax=Penicillium malachiteum TaxID=1324776 RepID=A0AAD6MW17_9EURO|nr:hypothetical protein N7493_004883 [Penicillium malachiteum]
MADYGGNDRYPNTFSNKVIQNLEDIAGKPPIFRVGGSTQHSAVYYPDQVEAIIEQFDSISSSQPRHSYIGPAFMQSFQNFPESTKFIFGLNFYNPENETLFDVGDGILQCVVEANAVYNAIGENLYGFEIGNEDYVDQWNEYAIAISQNLTGKDSLAIFQGCVFEAPRNVWSSTAWNFENAEGDGMRSNKAKSVADHEYMGAACDYTGVGPTIETTIFDRMNMLKRVWYHDYLGNVTKDSGIPYILGETNSISCQGAKRISDVLAAAVWAVDYVLYLSSLRVDRVHFHMGTRYPYASWIPVTFNDTAPEIKPIYYAALFNAHIFSGGEKQTEVWSTEQASEHMPCELESIVAARLTMWNSTFDEAKRPYTSLELPSSWRNAKVSRPTNPVVGIANNITMAGQSVNSDGGIAGEKTYESLDNGRVLVGAGEAVIAQH